jgi:hypothetical protein
MLPPDLAEVLIMYQQIREFTALLNEIGSRKSLDLLSEIGYAHQFAKNVARVLKTQRLIKIAYKNELS